MVKKMSKNVKEYIYSKFGENCFAKNEDGIPAFAPIHLNNYS